MNPSRSSTEVPKEGSSHTITSEPNPQYAIQPSLNQDVDSDDDWGYGPSPLREGYSNDRNSEGWRYFIFGGGLGQFLFTTSLGWQLFIGFLVLSLWGCGIALIVIQRTILWSPYLQDNYTSYTRLLYMLTGVYEFPYVLATTWMGLVLVHGWIVLSAYLTRWTSSWLRTAALSGMIAPSNPLKHAVHDCQGSKTDRGLLGNMLNWVSTGSGGIAGGGIFEFELPVVRQVFPLATIFVASFWLSSLSFAYGQYPIYVLSRIAIIPFSLLFTSTLGRTRHHWSIISSALTSTIALGISMYHPHARISRESIAFGVLSSVFYALYPVQVARTYNILLASLIPQGDNLSEKHPNDSSTIEFSGSKEEARAYWRLLHYTSTLSILIFTPIAVLFGGIPSFWRDFSSLDLFFYWLMVTCGSLVSWAVFSSTIALTRATSPLTTTFMFVPEASLMLAIMMGKRLPARSWVALSLCWASCGWYVLRRRKEGMS